MAKTKTKTARWYVVHWFTVDNVFRVVGGHTRKGNILTMPVEQLQALIDAVLDGPVHPDRPVQFVPCSSKAEQARLALHMLAAQAGYIER